MGFGAQKLPARLQRPRPALQSWDGALPMLSASGAGYVAAFEATLRRCEYCTRTKQADRTNCEGCGAAY